MQIETYREMELVFMNHDLILIADPYDDTRMMNNVLLSRAPGTKGDILRMLLSLDLLSFSFFPFSFFPVAVVVSIIDRGHPKYYHSPFVVDSPLDITTY